MAHILYGVMGNTNGHIARALSLASRLPEHEFYFVGGGRVPEIVRDSYPVLSVPVPRTVHKRQSVSVSATTGHLLRCWAQLPKVRRRILDIIHGWQPHLAICDREFFLPHAARAAGLRCVTLDHSHVLEACRYPVPPSQFVSWSLAKLEDELFFDYTRRNLIVSFFHPPLKRPTGLDELLPPVLRRAVTEIQPSRGDHVLIYQTSPTFQELIAAAQQLSRPVVVYGFRKEKAVAGNITFKPFDARAILEDLAGCAYAVVNGGHNLICEALSFGKPLLCFPIACHFEQFLNARYVRELGYGDFSMSRSPEAELFRRFESQLDGYRDNVAKRFVDGTPQVVNRVREIIEQT
jgi:uncharacterized protein (TIGR00661 family)